MTILLHAVEADDDKVRSAPTAHLLNCVSRWCFMQRLHPVDVAERDFAVTPHGLVGDDGLGQA